MPIDPRIALGYQAPQLESPVNMMGSLANIRNANNQNALAQYQLSSAQRADTVANTLNDAYQKAYNPQTGEIDTKLLRSAVAAGGAGSQLPGIEEGLAKAEAARTERDIKTSTLIGNHIELSRKGLEGVDPNAPDAADQYLAWHESNHADPVLANYLKSKGVTAEKSRADIMARIMNPDGTVNRPALTQMIIESKLGTEKALENHYVTRNLGGTVDELRLPKYGGGSAEVVRGSEGTVTAAPRAPMTAKEIADRNEAKDVVAQVLTDAAGNVRYINKFGDEIKPGAGKGAGKPTATYERTQNLRAQMKRDTDIVVAELKEITKDGGLIDQSTGSGFGRALDASAGFFGQETEGDIAIAKLQPIADKVVKMVPRFEGPQSDKDALSYQQAGGMLADPTLPTARRKAAAKEILRLHTKYPNQFVSSEMAAEGTGPAGGEARGMSADDKQALDWANANPNDPRAAKIKQRLGM